MRRSWLIAVAIHGAALFTLSRMPIRVVVPPPMPVEEPSVDVTAEPEGSSAAADEAPSTAPGAATPVPSVQLDIFSTNMDPTDIGAKPRRVVHSHLVDSQVM